ncbi:8983_t:CDS:2, partial [Dentiscutata erythropus]
PEVPPKKVTTRRLLSVVDKLQPYDILEDLLDAPARVIYRQMLQNPTQHHNLAKVLRQKKAPSTEANHLNANKQLEWDNKSFNINPELPPTQREKVMKLLLETPRVYMEKISKSGQR